MLQLDKKTVSEFETAGVQKLKVFFYEAGCSGTKIDMSTEFEVTDDLVLISQTPLPNPLLPGEGIKWDNEDVASSLLQERIERGITDGSYWFQVYVPKSDREYLENAKITRVIVADHTGEAKPRYIFAHDEVEDRCWCWTSFAFEKPVPVIDLEKLKLLRMNFKNKNI